MYTNSWDPNNGQILISTDQGKTFTPSVLPFKVGGNMPGCGMGEVSEPCRYEGALLKDTTASCGGPQQQQYPVLRRSQRQWSVEEYQFWPDLDQSFDTTQRR